MNDSELIKDVRKRLAEVLSKAADDCADAIAAIESLENKGDTRIPSEDYALAYNEGLLWGVCSVIATLVGTKTEEVAKDAWESAQEAKLAALYSMFGEE